MWLRRLALANVLAHVIGLFFAAFGMRPGTGLVELPTRRVYLQQFPPGWTVGWGVWMVCALLLVAFLVALLPYVNARLTLARLAALLAGAGAAVDLLCDAINLAVLPEITACEPFPEPLFLTVERITGVGGLVVANGLYTLATLLMTLALRERSEMPDAIVVAGYGVFLSGMGLVVAGLINSPWLAQLATGPTILLFCLWTVRVAWHLEPREKRP